MPDVTNESHISKFYYFLNHEPYGVTEVRIIKNDKLYKIGYFDNRHGLEGLPPYSQKLSCWH
jgi:hypothetical protein